jgi:hypothetical protein
VSDAPRSPAAIPRTAETVPEPLLLFDLWNDPLCVQPFNEHYPELVTKYTTLLEAQ